MNWYIIFAEKNKINEFLMYFNRQKEMKAFIPKIEKLMKLDGSKVFVETEMYPNYIFIETKLDEKEFYTLVEGLDKDTGSTMKLMHDDLNTVLGLTDDEKFFLESLMNEEHVIVHSTGIIVDSKLIVQDGPLVGKEVLIKKIDRHKKIALLDNVLGKPLKAPLEVVSKS